MLLIKKNSVTVTKLLSFPRVLCKTWSFSSCRPLWTRNVTHVRPFSLGYDRLGYMSYSRTTGTSETNGEEWTEWRLQRRCSVCVCLGACAVQGAPPKNRFATVNLKLKCLRHQRWFRDSYFTRYSRYGKTMKNKSIRF